MSDNAEAHRRQQAADQRPSPRPTLSADGTIIARLVSLQGGSGYVTAGAMIRER